MLTHYSQREQWPYNHLQDIGPPIFAQWLTEYSVYNTETTGSFGLLPLQQAAFAKKKKTKKEKKKQGV